MTLPWIETESSVPETLESLCSSVSSIAAQGLAIYPRGGGSSTHYGRTPVRPGVLVDTRRLQRVIDYPHDDMTITVESGVTLKNLQATLAKQGQFLPLDAPQADQATIGGVYASNWSGLRRFGWGRPRDLIIGIEFADVRGRLIQGGGRVVKNVAGFDFPKLLTGSMGTLGIIAQMTFKVRPRPASQALVWIPTNSATALDFWKRLNQSSVRPTVLEWLNSSSAQTVGKSLNLNNSPNLGALVVGFEDNDIAVRWQVDQLQREQPQWRLQALFNQESEPLWSTLTEQSAPQGAESGLWPLSIRAGLKPLDAGKLLEQLDPGLWRVQSHLGNGIVSAHRRAGFDSAGIAQEIDDLRQLVGKDGGYLTLPRCPEPWKKRLQVWGDVKPSWLLAKRVRQALDPQGVMNPGRFLDLD